MEFETTIALKPVTEVFVASRESFEEFCGRLHRVLSADGRHVGDGGNGEFWVDYSDTFFTKHLVVNVSEADGGFNLRFRRGKRFGHIGDVLIMLLILTAVYCVGKMFIPGPSLLNISGLAVSIPIILYFLNAYGRKFGTEESGEIIDRLI
jgi:hypothetical protein